jgi:hypothetical protein
MLPSTPEEKQAIIDYMNWQAPDLIVGKCHGLPGP